MKPPSPTVDVEEFGIQLSALSTATARSAPAKSRNMKEVNPPHSQAETSALLGDVVEAKVANMTDVNPPHPEVETSALLGDMDEGGKEAVSPERVVNKLFWRIVPIGMLTVLFCYMDRGNLGFAANTFCADIHLSTKAYGFGAAMFYAGYTWLQIPCSMLLSRVGAPTILGVILVLWGIVATAMAFVQTPLQFYLLRLALGLAEAGNFPALWYYFSVFFPESRITVALSMLELALVMSSPVSSPIAVGLLALDGKWGVAGWRWLFFVEGLFPVFLGIYVFSYWPKNVESAKFLTPPEKRWLLRNVKHTAANDTALMKTKDILADALTQLKRTVPSIGFWALTFAAFLRSVGMNTVLYFTTLIIHAFQQTTEEDTPDSETCSSSKSLGLVAVALSAIPFTIAGGANNIVAWIAEKSRNRSVFGGLAAMLPAGFFVFFPKVASNFGMGWGFVAYCIGVIACYAPFACIISLVISYIPQDSRPIGLALFNTLSMLGGLVGPYLTGYMVDKARDSKKGIEAYSEAVLIVGCIIFSSGIAVLLVKEPAKQQDKDALQHVQIQEESAHVD